MMTGLLSFLGGSAFRMIWGELSAFFTAKQQHRQELDRLKLQESIDAAAHARNLESIRLQSELGIKTIEAQRDSALSQIEVDAWSEVVRSTTKKTGITWIDAWNGAIRPLMATLSIFIVVAEAVATSFVLSEWTQSLVATVLGLYVADRSLAKRGK